jgi:hypothetical protein
MRGSSYVAALAASGLAAVAAAAPHPAAAKARAHQTAAAAHRAAANASASRKSARALAQMDLTPHDYLVRPYASAYQGGDGRTPLAVDYHFAADGVMSFGLHRGSGTPVDPGAVGQSFVAASPTTHNSVGALVTYSFR